MRVWNESWVDNIGLVAAGVAFYGFLAVVPLLGLLVLSYGMVTDPDTVVSHVMVLIHVLPADVAVLIGQLLMNAVQTSEQTKGFGFLIAVLVGLYAGGNGAGSIMTALNIAYEEEEKRSLSRFYLIAFTITAAAVLLALVALAATATVQALDRLIPPLSGTSTLAVGKAGLYILIALIAAAVAATLYRYGPSREDARWQWLTPGSIFTAAVWLALTNGFGFYVTRLTDYNAIYGSIAAVIMLLTWMYLSAYVFLFGAELNAELEHQTAIDSTTGRPEPLGERGAWAADHVAGVTDDGTSDGPSLGEAGPPSPAEEPVKRQEEAAAPPRAE
ncbi:YihY/virulence factor BrkB family protein [Sphingomonas sp. G124]|uniref:YihY/virulence factor BrkB family protein n=1 Tax=Sphingomonas cremea TaxID=2904799 RepID=A0A9X1QIJ8_9SPHN|nr:YihY/virulence factor BrkB family protein [Sphingomonas cremea]MCF2514050.1 YihY/virulence factor BrkB family protein [Sphingomonas cremea]